MLGTYSDFASRAIRDENDGKVTTLAGKVGFRQFFAHGIHVEASANIGWRNETERPDGASYDALQLRLWGLAGYQKEFAERFYANARVALGVHIYRSDRFATRRKSSCPVPT